MAALSSCVTCRPLSSFLSPTPSRATFSQPQFGESRRAYRLVVHANTTGVETEQSTWNRVADNNLSSWEEMGPSDVNLEENIERESSSEVPKERQKLFNNIAPMYDRLNNWLSLGQHHIWKRMTVNWSKAKKGDKVVDICCGSGDITFLLADKVGKSGSVIGIDFSEEQLAVAAKRQKEDLGTYGIDMRWVEGDALSLPFQDSEFDAVTMGYGLRNVIDIPLSLREIRRVLKPGSTAAILDFNNSSTPLVSTVQGFMLDNVVVPIADRFGVIEEYKYLRPSIERFPTGRRQVELAREAGFRKAVHYEVAGGLMGVLVLEK